MRFGSLSALRTTRGAMVQLGGGTAIGQGLVLLAAPITTRLYSPAEMGQFGVFSAFILFASVATSLRYDMAIVPARSDEEADRLLIIACVISLITAILFGALFALLIHERVLSFGTLSTRAAWAAGLLLAGTGLFASVRYWALRAQDYGQIGRAAIAQGLGRATLPILTGWIHGSWWGLASGELAGRVLGAGPLLRAANKRARATFLRDGWDRFHATARINWRYPVIVAPSALLDAMGAALAVPVVASVFGNAAAGQLVIVQRIAAVPAMLIGASVADVFHARISQQYHKDPSQMRPLVLRTVSKLTLAALAIYLPLGLLSAWAFAFVFGASWAEAGWLVALFTPLSVATLAIGPVTRLYAVVNRPEIKLMFDIGFICVPLISLSVLHSRGVSYWWCMTSYVLLATLAYLLHLALTLWASSLPPRHSPLDFPVR